MSYPGCGSTTYGTPPPACSLSQGIPARVVMERLGHSDIGLTLNTYSHVIPALRQEAADAMDRVFGS